MWMPNLTTKNNNKSEIKDRLTWKLTGNELTLVLKDRPFLVEIHGSCWKKWQI